MAFVSIGVGGERYSPGALTLGRLFTGSLVLATILVLRLPPWAAWPGIAGAGMLWFGGYVVALNWGSAR